MIEYIRRQVVLGCITEVVQPESVRQKAAYFMVPAVFLIIPQLEVILPGIARSTFFQILVLILSHDFLLMKYTLRAMTDILLLPVAALG